MDLINPFNLFSVHYLIFYLVLGSLVVYFTKQKIQIIESKWPIPKLNLTDPYLVAFIRGGRVEAIKVAVFSLIDRGLLVPDDRKLRSNPSRSEIDGFRPIEKAILSACNNQREISELSYDNDVQKACYKYDRILTKGNFYRNPFVDSQRRPTIMTSLIVLLFFGCGKIVWALHNGHYNINLLVLLTFVFSGLVIKEYFRSITDLKKRLLLDLKNIYSDLYHKRHTIEVGGGKAEVVILAALYGFSVLPLEKSPVIQKMFVSSSNSEISKYAFDYDHESSCSSCSGGSSCGGGGGCGGCSGN